MFAQIQTPSAFNLPPDGKLGFQFNWRELPFIGNYRQLVRGRILAYLGKLAVKDVEAVVPLLASQLEDKLFSDAPSLDDYMDQEKLLDHVQLLVKQRWYENSSLKRQSIHATGTNFGSCISNYVMTANINSNIVYPDNLNEPYLTVDVRKAGLHGPLKRTFAATLLHPEQVSPNNCLAKEYLCAGPADSGPTFSGCVLQSESGASFESHCKKTQYPGRGDLDLIVTSNQSSPLHTLSNEMHVQQPLLEPSQFEKKLPLPNLHYDENCLEKVKFSGGASLQNKRSYAFLDTAVRGQQLPSCDSFCQHVSNDVRCSTLRIDGSNCGNSFCRNTNEELLLPAKCRKLNSRGHGSSSDMPGLLEESIDRAGPLNLEKQSGSQVVVISDSLQADIVSHVTDPVGSIEAGDNVNVVAGSNSNFAITPFEGLCDDLQHKESEAARDQKYEAAPFEGLGADLLHREPEVARDQKYEAANVLGSLLSVSVPCSCEDKSLTQNEVDISEPKKTEHCKVLSDSFPSFCEQKSVAEDDKDILTNVLEVSEPKISGEGSLSSAATLTETKTEKQEDGISLIKYFTAEETEQHISSLKQKAEQGVAEEVGSKATCSVNENFCQLCALDKLAFAPMPIYCSSCGARVKNYQTYYSTADEDRAQFCFCSTCFHKCRGGNITFYGFSLSKSKLLAKKNNLVTEESWVQCDKCEGWQHQICALFSDKRDLGGNAEYICPKCHLKDLISGEQMTLPRTTSLDASNLPRTFLSDHLEQRLFKRLKQEREDRAKVAGKNLEEVPQPGDLVVRVVSSVDKRLKVKQEFLDIFPEKNYPSEFPYRSKVILLFQRIEGVDVCLFSMYVQEFGSKCSQPNQRCVYISYLDSVKYFRPETKTSKGEALRTSVYHEILVGYLDYCKKRGFATCYIWACPPVKGEDYILYCHPETQKTPRPEKLRLWYQSMLKKAAEEKIVVNFTNLYEKFFVPNGECNTKVTAARLPYFDGDYWSGVAESMIKKIEQESGGDPEQQIKKMTRRSLKAMGHTNPSSRNARDILLMQALAQSISSSKEDFIIVYLQFVCTHCHEVILSGKRWFCNQCKNYQLCESCHNKEQDSLQGDTHISSSGQKHVLHQEKVIDVPVDTEDSDAIMNNCFMENRQSFVNSCQGNHYQFDSLRRAKHSSMMILYHLHNPSRSSVGMFCSLCLRDMGADSKWTCEICPNFNVCRTCYQRSNASCHSHKLIELSAAITDIGNRVATMVRELMDVLRHASRCQPTVNHVCSYPKCALLKRLFFHGHNCSVRASGGCTYCRKIWFILMLHSRRCKVSNCIVPRCMELKKHFKMLETVSKTKHSTLLLGDSRQTIL